LLVLAACEPSAKRAPVKDDAAAVVAPRDAAVDAAVIDAVPKKVFITGSGRCGECHEKMFDEWEVSAHANAVSSSFYKASVASAKDATCDRCHAPLAKIAPRDIVVSEGVTCDVCHTLREPVPAAGGGTFRLAVDDMVKYGPRCNLKDHYFHRMGCSPEHREAALCGTCHWWEPRGIPVLTEYADWKAGPAAEKGLPCQGCHMPKSRAEIATGSPVRKGVPHHGLLGLASDLRRRALGLEVTVKEDAGALAVAVTVQNHNAGHAVPAGLPERRLLVRARVLDAAGTEVASDSRQLGRKLVDAAGHEAPFWRAVKVASDTRIPVGGSWQDTLRIAAANAGTLEVDVVYRGMPDAIAKELAISEIEEHPMVKAKIRLGGKLPRSVTVKPPAAGKRAKRAAR
jgi:hypothetical protein